jgi:hypothetical protein
LISFFGFLDGKPHEKIIAVQNLSRSGRLGADCK